MEGFLRRKNHSEHTGFHINFQTGEYLKNYIFATLVTIPFVLILPIFSRGPKKTICKMQSLKIGLPLKQTGESWTGLTVPQGMSLIQKTPIFLGEEGGAGYADKKGIFKDIESTPKKRKKDVRNIY